MNPKVHVADPSLDPSRPGSVRASVPNAVAYARYGADLLEGRVDGSADVVAITRRLAAASAASGLSAARAFALYAGEASADEQEALRREVLDGALGLGPDTPLATVGRRVADALAQKNACVADGASAAACCAALATPWFLVDAYGKLTPEARAGWSRAASEGYDALAAAALAEDPQPFEHQNIKAWLAACAGDVRHAPGDLDDLRARFGDYRSGSWARELHPVSMAKLAPRRIYRSPDGSVAVAESIGEDCAVRETEVIVRGEGGLLDFWSFDGHGRRVGHGFFPARLRVDAIKFTPDACLGCHYKLDTRSFDVMAPSYRALGLVLRRDDGAPQWIDGSACTEKGDRVIWHERDATRP